MDKALIGVPAAAPAHAPSAQLEPPALLLQGMQAIRRHMEMDVAFISEFKAGRRVFRYLDTGLADPPIRVGGSDPLEDSYCQRVADGRLPALIPDACQNAEALTLAATLALPVGAHLSVPIRLGDGRIFGTFCCFRSQPNTALNQRDVATMRVFADLMARHFELELEQRELVERITSRIDQALQPSQMRSVYQPIFDLPQGRVVGFEALTRFDCEPQRTPDLWFQEAARVERGVELELHAIRLALAALEQLPASCYIAVNASPRTVIDGRLTQMLAAYPLERIVLEVTEHEEVEQYSEIAHVVNPLHMAGLRVAVDDAGAGYACFKHILNLAPDIIKLDNSITRGIDVDPSRQALAAALTRFAETTGGKLVAEGVETSAELNALQRIGIRLGQGYVLGRPATLQGALEQTQRSGARPSPAGIGWRTTH
ncbi:EAL domain-containing protein [Roseateles sp. DAIF2]|uniref:sensor domain-containing phosphodiesterase n=1 Tax=Roseateles sp. DAIF2 TaxID=2714952 RepID=UPI0018A2B0AB|nr:EAL domain-containing protein [Roseateles sp. DAIF2]QPF74501.1 EAL domain-containing protein [Roseateles sp. DAIF2]